MGGGEDAGAQERMSDLEALMWALEADPHLSSGFANISFLDRSPDHELLRRKLWRASRVVPRLRRRVAPGFGPLNPAWEDDPDFDIDRHVRRIELPAGATDRDALDMAAEISAAPFERDRPLWVFTVLDGLPHGRAAMVQKMHHTITDGEGGIRMSVEFIDIQRESTEPPPVDDGPPSSSTSSHGLAGMVVRNVRSAETAVRGLQTRLGSAASTVVHPTELAGLIADLPAESAATLRSVARQFGVFGSFRSPEWTARSLDRTLEVLDVSLDDVKDAAAGLGGSVNDLFVAAAAGGAGAYHRARGFEVDELRMSMPVSNRSGRTSGGNSFTPTRVLVPVDPDPRRRFEEINRRLAVTKTERAMGLTTSLAGVAKALPRPVLVRMARQQVMTVDFTTSNLKAAPFDLYIAGALMEHNYPLGPLLGTAWNLTTMSYRGRLDLGLHVDARAVDEPAELAAHIAEAFDELFAAAR